MSFINIDAAVQEKFLRLYQCKTILALDPSMGSAGYALSIDSKLIDSGQGKLDDVIHRVDNLIRTNDCRIDVLVVEDPFFIGKGNQWKLAWAAGALSYAFRSHLSQDAVFWRPLPSQWRAVLGLNTSQERDFRGRKKRDRETVDNLVFEFCRAKTGLALSTVNGKIESDRCMAIGMLLASRRIANALVKKRETP